MKGRTPSAGVVAVWVAVALVVEVIVVNAVRSIGPKQTPAETAAAAAAAEEHARLDRNRANAAENRSWAPPDPTPTPVETAAERKAREDEEMKQARKEWRAAKKKSSENLVESRRLLAKIIENGMLAKGLDMRVEARGKGRKHLKITYILANRPFVYREMHDSDFIASVRAVGFEEITFTDGYDFSEGYHWDRP